MYRFNISIHPRPAEAIDGPEIDLGGLTVGTLTIPHEALSHAFHMSFEAAIERLSSLDRLFCEPDGSFFWGSPHDGPRWQLDGNLFDRNGRLLFVDLKGTCPAAEFDQLLAGLGWPETPFAFQLVREAVFLAEPEFRRWAEAGVSAISDEHRRHDSRRT